jgi:hypothetical protein
MKRRLYFLLPDASGAQQTLDELLLARVDDKHMRFWANESTHLTDIPQANFLDKTDLIHASEVGMLIGAGVGLLGGILLLFYPPEGFALQTGTILMTSLAGAVFGAWVSGMAGAAIPNSRMKAFQDTIERGGVLLIVDVPLRRTEEIEDLMAQRHPEIRFCGIEPHIPVFP